MTISTQELKALLESAERSRLTVVPPSLPTMPSFDTPFRSPTMSIPVPTLGPDLEHQLMLMHLGPDLAREVIGLREENARLQDLLKPFAAEADAWDNIPETRCHGDEVALSQNGNRRTGITIGDCRRARTALNRTA